MNDELFRRFVRDLVEDLAQVSGASLEKLLKPLWDKMAGAPVQANGLNLQGAPISGALDALWPDGSASEASSHSDYFDSREKKLRHDIRHIRKAAPHVSHLRMFSTRPMGPTARTRQDKRRARYAAKGFTIDVAAAQDIAEYIVGKCLLDDVLVKRIAPILPNLQRITEQFAASQRVPDLDAAFLGRAGEIEAVKARLAVDRCVVVSGLGGIGKTELACALAHEIQEQYEQVIWIDASNLHEVAQLGAFDVRSNGYQLNVLGLLRSQNALVVLDDVTVDLDLAALGAHCGPASNVVLTSQAKWGASPFHLEELQRPDAGAILSAGAASPCPDKVLDRVLEAVGAHPLLLRILNRLVTEAGASWEEVVAECDHLPDALDDRRQTVAQRIVRRNLPALAARLAPFLWIRIAAIDAGLLRHLIGVGGVADLRRWAFLARSERRAERLHDIVFGCTVSLADEITVQADDLRTRLEEHLRGAIDPKDIDFVRIAHRHRSLLERLLLEGPAPGIIRYAYLHSSVARDLDPALIGDPAADVAGGPAGPRREWVLSVVEAVESSYRHTRDLGEKDRAKRELRDRLDVFDQLQRDPELDADSVTTVRHHRAKSLVKLGEVEQAKGEFEAIVADNPRAFPSKLQLARLLEDDPDRAKGLIFEIIEAEREDPGSVQITTFIETLATLRRRHLHKFNAEMTRRYGPFMAQMIKAAAWSGEAQPVRAFAAVGPDWSYTQPTLFQEVFEEIELGAPSAAEDDDERVAVARICVAATKMYAREGKSVEADAALGRALEFFEGLGSVTPFAAAHYADARLLAKDALGAGEVLDAVPDAKRDSFWHLRRAEALQAAGVGGALECIERGIGLLKQPKYLSTFLSRKAELLHAAGDGEALTVLREAIARCEEPKFRDELQQRLDDWLAPGPTS